VRQLFGISVFWIALSVLFDGLSSLVLPHRLLSLTDEATKATTLGLVTFVGLLVGMVVQPIAGAWSDRLRPNRGRRGPLGAGVLLILFALAVFGSAWSLPMVLLGYLLVQATASVAQAAQQGFIPDLVDTERRGTAAGLKLLMDVGGALLSFVLLSHLLAGSGTELAALAITALVIAAFLLTVGLVREPAQPVDHDPAGVPSLDAFRVDLDQHRPFAWLVWSRFLFLLGTYAVGRFFLFFVADRLGLEPGRVAQEAGGLLAGLTVVTVLAALPGGWAADRFGWVPLMLIGALLSAAGVGLLITATSSWDILLFGGLMAVGSATFSTANWALVADLAPPAEAARFLGLANIGTAGAAAAVGLLGPVVDWANASSPGDGYTTLFVAAIVAFLASGLALRGLRGTSVIPTTSASTA
jgi:MFS family permease